MSRLASPMPPVATMVADITKRGSRQVAFNAITSVKECVDILPTAYRATARDIFNTLSDITEKYGRVNKVFQTFRHHRSKGTFPPQIECVHEPSFLFTKEFSEHAETVPEAKARLLKMRNLWSAYRSDLLTAAIDAKREELLVLEARLQPKTYWNDIVNAMERVYERQLSFYKGADGKFPLGESIIEDVEMVTGADTPTAGPSGSAEPSTIPASRFRFGQSGDKEETWLKSDRDIAVWDAPRLAARVIDITRNRDLEELEKAIKKLSIKKAATAVEEDAITSLNARNADFDARVRAAVQSALAKQKNG
ncbi:hypothetical protein FN846DRAFT_915158 [Sphaerosporella brunnea]|uniref:Uncharacterized protein n=1 Tax=Sphaerosporella brunnea TaxID=1250544 RepID=A0A5J5ECW7_9PEZI|nr:hypothetical protein FN846DRAFT_915158 [Sphaerosporella brunnea]